MAELLPETDRRVQLFYYGEGLPIGFCARNFENGIFIDALVVPLTPPGEEKPAKDKKPAEEPTPAEPGTADQQPEEGAPASEEAPAEPKKARKGKKDALKSKYQNAKDMLLLFRAGDFYEAYFDDAETIAPILGLTLTTRDKAPMAGFPHHALQEHLQKLLKDGHRVAICDEEGQP